jgi:short-subunit dehydrogenase
MVTKSKSNSKTATTPSANSNHGKSSGVALITGASSGIGEALAHCFAASGHDLILVARSADKLKALAGDLASQYGVKAQVAAADLTRAGAVQNLAAMLHKKQVNIRVLVNCAGVLEQGAFLQMDATKLQQMIDLNITALTAMLQAFVPGMVEAAAGGGRASILNVASIAAFQPIPMLATYAASKAYVLSLSESLAEELKGTGVSVTTLCPGITATNMLTMAAGANDRLGKLPSCLIADVKDVAQAGFEAAMRGDAICIPGVVNQLGMLGSRATPKWLVRKLGGLIGRNAL